MKKLIFVSIMLVIIDQITKYFMQEKSFLPGKFLSLRYTTNTGAAFGILKGLNWLFVTISLIVIIAIFFYYIKHKNFGLILLFAGAVGNLIDRLMLGFVRDFIYLKYFSTFNLADVYNVIGVFIIIIYMKKLK